MHLLCIHVMILFILKLFVKKCDIAACKLNSVQGWVEIVLKVCTCRCKPTLLNLPDTHTLLFWCFYDNIPHFHVFQSRLTTLAT